MIRGVWLDERDYGQATSLIIEVRESRRRGLTKRLAENLR